MPDRVFRMVENGGRLFGEAFVVDIPSTRARDEFLPGTKPGTAENVRYVSFDRSENPPDLFAEVVDQVCPPLPKRGRAMLEKVILTAPEVLLSMPLSTSTAPTTRTRGAGR